MAVTKLCGVLPLPSFYLNLREAGVGNEGPFRTWELPLAAFLGVCGWVACLVLYLIMMGHADNEGYGPLSALLLTNIVLHCATLAGVLVDAYGFSGSSILLQTLIQAMGSYITFSLAGIGGFWLLLSSTNSNGFVNQVGSRSPRSVSPAHPIPSCSAYSSRTSTRAPRRSCWGRACCDPARPPGRLSFAVRVCNQLDFPCQKL